MCGEPSSTISNKSGRLSTYIYARDIDKAADETLTVSSKPSNDQLSKLEESMDSEESKYVVSIVADNLEYRDDVITYDVLLEKYPGKEENLKTALMSLVYKDILQEQPEKGGYKFGTELFRRYFKNKPLIKEVK